MISETAALLAANEAFYAAFASRDIPAMERLWAVNAPVACVHPGWDVLHGRGDVMEAWRRILEGAGAPGLRCERARAAVLGDAGFVTCLERLGEGALIATNVFVLEDECWRIVHHQAGPVTLGEGEPENRVS